MRLFAQKLLFQSALWALDADGGATQSLIQDGAHIAHGLNYPPLYYLAVCAHTPDALSGLPALSLYGDAHESVYAHYDDEVRRNIAARARIAAQESEIATLKHAASSPNASVPDSPSD